MFEIIRRLIVAGVALGVIAGNSDEITKFYDDIVSETQRIATVGDLRSISNMLDYEFMKRGRYPKTENFEKWMEKNFKESHLKALAVDHWGNGLIYTATKDQRGFILVSRGPDDIIDTDDDLKYTGP